MPSGEEAAEEEDEGEERLRVDRLSEESRSLPGVKGGEAGGVGREGSIEAAFKALLELAVSLSLDQTSSGMKETSPR